MTDSGRVEYEYTDDTTVTRTDDTTRRTTTAALVCRECGGAAVSGFPAFQPLHGNPCCAEPGRWWCARAETVCRVVPGDE